MKRTLIVLRPFQARLGPEMRNLGRCGQCGQLRHGDTIT